MNLFQQIIHSIRDTVTSSNFWRGLIVSVTVAFLTVFGKWLWRVLRDHFRTQAFTIAGYWVGYCLLPSYQGKANLEIWRYSLKGGSIMLSFFAYEPDKDGLPIKPTRWLGGGIWRGSKFSAYYYLDRATSFESGVLALEVKGPHLKGIYAQFDPNEPDEPLYVSQKDYVQFRIRELQFCSRVKMLFGRPPVESYKEVEKIYKQAYGSRSTI